jgi:hypothetical protein
MAGAAVAGLLLHTGMILWGWQTSGYFSRGIVVAWMDFPASLAYVHLEGTPMLAWSLAAGGLQWAGIAALLTFLLGRTLKARALR